MPAATEAAATEPVLDIDRVLFLDARNRKFVEKKSSLSSRAQDASGFVWQMVLILLIVGGVLLIAVFTLTVDSHLSKSGRVITGIITGKIQSKQSCRVTYQFTGPPIYERTADIAYNLCPLMTEGKVVQVVYDPQQPLYSDLKLSMEKPRYPIVPVAIFFLIALALIPVQISKARRERRMCAEGQIICGSLLSKDIDSDLLTIRYRFKAPAGFIIQSHSQGRVGRSNWSYDAQFFPDKPNQVMVLYLNEAEFHLL